MTRDSSLSTTAERTASYVRAAVAVEIAAVRSTVSGRAPATFRAAAALGSLLATGELDPSEIEELLVAAAVSTGLPEREARRNVRNGLKRGAQSPREIPQPTHSAGPVRSVPVQTLRRVEEPPKRPPRSEVETLWGSSSSISSDDDVIAWFRRRFAHLAPSVIELTEFWSLARVLPRGERLPRWAWSPEGRWSDAGHRLLFRAWNEDGAFVSLRARSLRPDAELKSVVPSGHAIGGLVLADPLAVQLLSGATLSWWTPGIVITEGEVDWLSWAARQSDAVADSPAYFGVEAGAWSDAIAARVPDGARVVIRTDHDEPGQRYADHILATLRGRCVLYRSRADEEAER